MYAEETGAACSITCLPAVGTIEPKTPPLKLSKLVSTALVDFGMIQEGDRLLLGLSGGKVCGNGPPRQYHCCTFCICGL